MTIGISSTAALRQNFNVKGLVFLLGKICVVLAVVLAHATADIFRHNAQRQLLTTSETNTTDLPDEIESAKPLENYGIISSRNLFGPEPQASPTTTSPTPATPLNLRLVGTNVNSSGAPMAIVEDTVKKEQDVFSLNERIFDRATLIEVLDDQIKVDYSGKVEILAISEGDGSATPEQSATSEDSGQTDFTVPEDQLADELANLPRLLSQARAVPYFRDGKSIGMRLFAIRQGSLYEKLGLKNGDIILSVNSSSISDPAQALKLFEQLKTERSINVQVERNGQNTELKYSIR